MSAEYAALEMRFATRLAQAHENALTEYARLEKVKDDAIREAEIEAENIVSTFTSDNFESDTVGQIFEKGAREVMGRALGSS